MRCSLQNAKGWRRDASKRPVQTCRTSRGPPWGMGGKCPLARAAADVDDGCGWNVAMCWQPRLLRCVACHLRLTSSGRRRGARTFTRLGGSSTGAGMLWKHRTETPGAWHVAAARGRTERRGVMGAAGRASGRDPAVASALRVWPRGRPQAARRRASGCRGTRRTGRGRPAWRTAGGLLWAE